MYLALQKFHSDYNNAHELLEKKYFFSLQYLDHHFCCKKKTKKKKKNLLPPNYVMDFSNTHNDVSAISLSAETALIGTHINIYHKNVSDYVNSSVLVK